MKFVFLLQTFVDICVFLWPFEPLMKLVFLMKSFDEINVFPHSFNEISDLLMKLEIHDHLMKSAIYFQLYFDKICFLSTIIWWNSCFLSNPLSKFMILPRRFHEIHFFFPVTFSQILHFFLRFFDKISVFFFLWLFDKINIFSVILWRNPHYFYKPLTKFISFVIFWLNFHFLCDFLMKSDFSQLYFDEIYFSFTTLF